MNQTVTDFLSDGCDPSEDVADSIETCRGTNIVTVYVKLTFIYLANKDSVLARNLSTALKSGDLCVHLL
jgi:hypothetical protein